MRIFPHYWEEYHPAFPKSPFPPGYNSFSGDIFPATLVSTLFGAGGATLGVPFRQAFNFGARCTTWSALFYVSKTGLDLYREKEQANKYLTAEGIQLDRRAFDRVGYLDQDDLTLGGCIAWLAIASRRRWLHPQLRPLTYYPAHSVWAISAIYLTQSVARVMKLDNATIGSMLEEDKRLQAQRRSYAAEVLSTSSIPPVKTEFTPGSRE